MSLEVLAYLPVVSEVSMDPGVSMMAMTISEEARSEASKEAEIEAEQRQDQGDTSSSYPHYCIQSKAGRWTSLSRPAALVVSAGQVALLASAEPVKIPSQVAEAKAEAVLG